MTVNANVANFSLANQDNAIGEAYEEMKSESEQDEPEHNEDEDAPQTFKANFVRRTTVLRN